jgi:sulfopyruvate decarboxylase subunit beta
MKTADALTVLAEQRRDQVVIATMGAEREWLHLSQHTRDFFYVPSSMGQAPTLGLGLALARPDLRVLVLNGDGCMLMNLGCLVTIADQAPANYALVVFSNGVYEVTGAQPLAGAGRIDFSLLARDAGWGQSHRATDIDGWKAILPVVLHGTGPVFTELVVQPVRGSDVSPRAPCPMPDQLARFAHAIAQP